VVDQAIRVLLIEDDEDDFVLTRDLLSEVSSGIFDLEWASSFEEGLDKMQCGEHDVCLLDYRLGDRTGLDLMQEARQRNNGVPVILLTGQGDHDVDVTAMMCGAADYLEKNQISVAILERAIRYAIERKRVEAVLRNSERQLKDLSSKLLETQEAERRLLAQELHDGIAGTLVGIKFSLESKLIQMTEGKGAQAVSLERIIGQVQNVIEELAMMSTRLRPLILDDLGIVDTLDWFCKDFQNTYPGIRIDSRIDVSEEEVPDLLKVVIYRIVQEASNNVAKHSKADRLTLSLNRDDDILELYIEDNGQGLDMDGPLRGLGAPGGMGLTGMKERADLSGGSFAISSTKGAGTSLRAIWKVGSDQ
jgi:signal transduction histidine kinase